MCTPITSTSPHDNLDTRTLIVSEIFQVEKSYVDSLQFLLTVSIACISKKEEKNDDFQKYLTPLKKPENSHIIDPWFVDEIFYQVSSPDIRNMKKWKFQIPNIHFLHQGFLDDLRRRMECWDDDKTIGDWFLDSVSLRWTWKSLKFLLNSLQKRR